MSDLCKIFFADLTNTIVAKQATTNYAASSLHRPDLGIGADSVLPTTEDYLYSDNYIIHLEKLIAPEYQEKLRLAFGDEWLNVVNGMYKKIERKVHDDMICKLSAISFADDLTDQGADNEE